MITMPLISIGLSPSTIGLVGRSLIGTQGIIVDICFNPNELIYVSRWANRPNGLQNGDWVMKGKVNYWNYIKSGKWKKHRWNEYSPYSTGEQHLVKRMDLSVPPSIKNPIIERKWKSLYGQRLPFSLYNITNYNFIYLLLLSLSIDLGCLFGIFYNFLLFHFINKQVEKLNIFLRYKNSTKLKKIKNYIKTLNDEEKEKIIFSQNFPHTLAEKQHTFNFYPTINNFFYIYQKIKIHNIKLDVSLFKPESLDLFQIGLYGKHPIFINIKNNQIVDKPFFSFYKDNSINFYDYLLVEILYYKS